MSSLLNDARRTGIDKRRVGPHGFMCNGGFNPEDFLELIHGARENHEAAENLFFLLNMLPDHARTWMLFRLLTEDSGKIPDNLLISLLEGAVSSAGHKTGCEPIIKVIKHTVVQGNLGYYRFHAVVADDDYGCAKFRNKPAGTLFLMYLVHRVQNPFKSLTIMDVGNNKDAFVAYHRALYGVKGGNPETVFESLFTDSVTKAQGSLRYLYGDINQTLTNLFSYHASSTPFEVHRTTHIAANLEQLVIPRELVAIANIL